MNLSGIIEYLEPLWGELRGCMKDALATDIQLLSRTNGNILDHSGKMLRPMIALLVAQACGQANVDSCRYAAAVELLHNATLLHDDVADESMERRGVPTVNATLGSHSAVLIGDFWLAKTMNVIFDAEHRRTDVLSLFSKTLVHLAEGEMLQLEKAGLADTSEKDYLRIIFCKTASLFVSSCEAAAISVDAPEEYYSAAGKFGHAAGMAFQIKDDILDYAGDSLLGKPVGLDIRERKITLPLLCALEGSEREQEIRAMVRDVCECPENCEKVREFVRSRHGVEKAAAVLSSYVSEAVEALRVFPDSEARRHLEELARFIELRNL